MRQQHENNYKNEIRQDQKEESDDDDERINYICSAAGEMHIESLFLSLWNAGKICPLPHIFNSFIRIYPEMS